MKYKAFWLFLQHILKQLRRKWLSLPLLFLFPIIIVFLVSILLISLFTFSETEPIHVALVDLDKSTETKMVVQLIKEGSELGNDVQITSMSEKEASEAINDNKLSAYIIFPENFTANLYEGTSTVLPIVGNPNQQIESLLIREIIDSVIRHIRASQANILAINHFAKELGIADDTRNEIVFEQFKEFVFYTLSSNQVIQEKQVTNMATSNPVEYFVIASLFIIVTIWIFINYNLFYRQIHLPLKERIQLYGVTEFPYVSARICIALMMTMIFFIVFFIGLHLSLDIDIGFTSFLQMFLMMILYCLLLLSTIAIVELLLPTAKIRIFIQSIFILFSIILSGAIIPIIYYPIWLENLVKGLFFTKIFDMLIDITLYNQLHIDILPLFFQVLMTLLVLISISIGKERWR